VKIFLSYATEIRDRAESVNAALLAAGHDVFFDREDLPAGQGYDDRIRSAIEGSDLFLFLISPAAVATGHYTRTELKIARRRWPDPAGHVLPVMVTPTPFGELPAYLGSVTILVPEGNLAAEVVLAVSDLAAHSGPAPAPQPPAAEDTDNMDAGIGAGSVPHYASLKLCFSYADAGRYSIDIQRPLQADIITGAFALDAAAVEDTMRTTGVQGDGAVRRPSGALAGNGLPTAGQAREAGRLLYQALFCPGLRPGIEDSLRGIDPQQGKGLRFVIDTTDTPELGRLPWEFLYSPEKDDFLFSDRMKPVVRWLDVDEPTPTLKISPPLRVLIAFASPGGVAPLQIGEELARLDEALMPLTRRGLISITTLEHTTLERLDEALLNVRPHVLHFIGHGDFNGGDGLLLLESDTPDRAPDPLTGRRLGVLLRNHLDTLRLVFLNSCVGATVSPVDPFGGIAQTLIRRGVPAVIAMQFVIPDKAAIELSRHFYRYLAAGQPVDAALTSARAFLFARGYEVEWGAPALHMRSPDGRLFDIGALPAAAPPLPPVQPPVLPPSAVEAGPGPATVEAGPPAAEARSPAVQETTGAAPAPTPPEGTAPAAARRGVRVWVIAVLGVLIAGVVLFMLALPELAKKREEPPVAMAPAPATLDSAGSVARRAIVQLDRQDYAGAVATLEAALDEDERALDPSALGGDAERLAEKLMVAAQRVDAIQPELAQRLARLYHRIAPEEAAMAGEAAPAPAEEEGQGGGGQAAPAPGEAGEWGGIVPGAGMGGADDRREPLYVVRAGDTLSGIAARLWGNAQAWPQLIERHNTFSQTDPRLRTITDPDYILVGEPIASPSDNRGGWYYHVQRGDTLWGISARMYSDGRLWPRIAEANTDIVTDPDLILPGMALHVPVAPD
jgi:nucleoid-associated protein YgaU